MRGEANVSKLRYPLLLLDTSTYVLPYPFVSPSSLGQSGQKGVAGEQAGEFEGGMVAERLQVIVLAIELPSQGWGSYF